MKRTLEQLYKDHEGKFSDKWSLYLTELDRLFDPYRDRPIGLLEIGIQNGGSLEIWDKYFTNAVKIVGCDIDPKCAALQFTSPRIAVVVGDANSDRCENEVLRHTSTFDIIIDDGSHTSSDIIKSFFRYFPHLNFDGIFVVEDLHCSYWYNFAGGLYYPFSAMAFFKRLTDIINHEHWRTGKSPADLVASFGKRYNIDFRDIDFSTIHSVEFINSLCVIRKSFPENNTLGRRYVVGMDEFVTSETKRYHGAMPQDISAGVKDDGEFDVFELIERNDALMQSIRNLTEQLVEGKETIAGLRSQVAQKDQALRDLNIQREQEVQKVTLTDNELEQMKKEVLAYALSRSWRYTRPVRKALQWISRRKNVQEMG